MHSRASSRCPTPIVWPCLLHPEPQPCNPTPGIYLLVNGNDLIRFIEDAQLRIKSLSTSVFVEPHKDSVIQWDEALSSVRVVLEGETGVRVWGMCVFVEPHKDFVV